MSKLRRNYGAAEESEDRRLISNYRHYEEE